MWGLAQGYTLGRWRGVCEISLGFICWDDCQYLVESTIAEVGVMTIVVSSVENMFVQGWRLKGKELVRSLEGALKGKCRHPQEFPASNK